MLYPYSLWGEEFEHDVKKYEKGTDGELLADWCKLYVKNT